MLILMASLVGFAGLAYDAGMAFYARREATNIAAAAARAGTNVVDTDALYGLGSPILDSDAAGVARRTAYAAGAETVRVERTGPFELKVSVTLSHDNVFLGLVGIDSYTVDGEATVKVESKAE